MTEIDSSAVQEQTITVPEGHNLLVISLRDHSWVSFSQGDQEISINRTTAPGLSLRVSPGIYRVRSDGVIASAGSETTKSVFLPLEQLLRESPAQLRLSSDAPDQHVADGIGEIPANGTSWCTVTIEAVPQNDAPLTGEAQQAEVFLRTTGGVLMDAAGENRVRSVTLKSGRAAFRLVSETNPKVVTITAFGQGSALLKADIQIEFV